MLRNYTDEDYLKGYSPKLTALLWTDETDYSAQKTKAVNRVMNALSQSYDLRDLMPELDLRSWGDSISSNETGEGVEDKLNRMRLVINNITCTTSGKTLTLQGSNDNITYYEIDTIDVLTTDTEVSMTFDKCYKYYRINTAVLSGAIDFRAYLVETSYDELFACMWLYFIYFDISKQEGDQFDKKKNEVYAMYEGIMRNLKIRIDTDNDGEVDEVSIQNSITMLK